MIELEINGNTNDITKYLKKLNDNTTDLTKAFQLFSFDWKKEIKGFFDTETSPDGKKWKHLSPRYEKWKKQWFPGKKILELKGDMKNESINFKKDIQKKSISMTVENIKYANRQHYDRNFFYGDNGLSDKGWELLMKHIIRHLTEDDS